MRHHRPFTLVELLVVVSLIAVVAGGVIVSYVGIERDATEQMTLHEMHQIKQAFERFQQDNSVQLNGGLEDHAGALISDKMDYLATYGLWPLLQRRISEPTTPNPNAELGEYDPTTGQGWNGPYLESAARKALQPENPPSDLGGYVFPQIADQYSAPSAADKHYYRVYFLDYTYNSKNYRRLFLVCSRGGPDPDVDANNALKNDDIDGDFASDPTFDDDDLEALIDTSTGAVNLRVGHCYFVELLNEDT